VFLSGAIVLAEKKTGWKLFKYIPAVVMIYFLGMLLSTFKVWQKTDSVNAAYNGLRNNLLYAMIFLMLLRCDLRKIAKLGGRMIGGFFACAITIGFGFIVTYAVLHKVLGAGSWRAFAALCGSWIGGTGNMVAVQSALNINEADMGYTLLIDSINYSIWVMFLLWSVSFAGPFNKWTKSNTTALDEVGRKLEETAKSKETKIDFPSIIFLMGASLILSALSQYFGKFLPTNNFFATSTWVVLIITVLGVVFAMTPVAAIPGNGELANTLLYVIVALIASRANFAELTQAPLYVAAGFLILGIHAVLMIIVAKLFKLDLFTCGVASLANIGGVASAPILAGSYSGALIPVGVLMALMGYIVGTAGGLAVGMVMSLFG
jgi:uncharacterized membrane protein